MLQVLFDRVMVRQLEIIVVAKLHEGHDEVDDQLTKVINVTSLPTRNSIDQLFEKDRNVHSGNNDPSGSFVINYGSILPSHARNHEQDNNPDDSQLHHQKFIGFLLFIRLMQAFLPQVSFNILEDSVISFTTNRIEMEEKHDEVKCKPIDIYVIIFKCILLVSLSLMLQIVFAKYSSHFNIKQEDYRGENIKVVTIDLHDNPAVCQVFLVMVNFGVLEVQQVELLEKNATLIEEDLARSQDQTNVFKAIVIKHLLHKLHESD